MMTASLVIRPLPTSALAHTLVAHHPSPLHVLTPPPCIPSLTLTHTLMHTVVIAVAHPYMDTLVPTHRLEWIHLIYFST